MASSFSFRLPIDPLRITPVLRAGRSIARKEYIVLFSFSGSEAKAGVETAPTGLNWSESRGAAFAYTPPTDLNLKRGDALVRLPTIEVPRASHELTLEIQPSTTAANDPAAVFLDTVLETELLERSTIIFAEES